LLSLETFSSLRILELVEIYLLEFLLIHFDWFFYVMRQ